MAYSVLDNWVHNPLRFVLHQSGTAFATSGEGEDDRDLSHITCYNCQQQGHYAAGCRNEPCMRAQGPVSTNQEGTQMLVSGIEGDTTANGGTQFTFSQAHGRNIPATWILLDNQSTVDIFKNWALLMDIREVAGTMTVHCNAGTRVTNMQGSLPTMEQYGLTHKDWPTSCHFDRSD